MVDGEVTRCKAICIKQGRMLSFVNAFGLFVSGQESGSLTVEPKDFTSCILYPPAGIRAAIKTEAICCGRSETSVSSTPN